MAIVIPNKISIGFMYGWNAACKSKAVIMLTKAQKHCLSLDYQKGFMAANSVKSCSSQPDEYVITDEMLEQAELPE